MIALEFLFVGKIISNFFGVYSVVHLQMFLKAIQLQICLAVFILS